MKNVLAIVILFSFCSTAIASNQTNKTIKSAHVNIGSGYYFKTNEVMVDPGQCGNTAWYKLGSGTYAKEAFSVLLAAKMSGKKVDFHIDGCGSGYPKVIWINVHGN